MTRYMVEATVTVQVDVDDDSVTTRCVENRDDAGMPQPDERGSGGWRNMFYDLRTPEAVVEHLAYNLGINGRRLSQLDGWADMPDGAATAHIEDIDYYVRAQQQETR